MNITFSDIIDGVFEYIPTRYADSRGHFFESYNGEQLREVLETRGLSLPIFVQENQSYSIPNVLRGLHYQTGVHAQGKLIRVITGSVMDVAVDLRPSSKTYLNHQVFILNGLNSVYLPPGLAHGFYALEETIFQYKCTQYYCKEAEAGIRYDDPILGIKWPSQTPVVSEKDLELPFLSS